MLKYLFLTFYLLVTTSIISNGQSAWVGFSTEYNLPGGNLKWIYKGAPGVQLNYSWVLKKNKGGYPGYGVTIGYIKFSPKADTLYYLVYLGSGNTGYGTASYSSRKLIQLSSSFFWTMPSKTKKTELIFGTEIGYYYSFFNYDFNDDLGSESGKEIEGKGALVPYFSYALYPSKNVRIAPYFKFNLFFSLGSNDSESITYNPNFGTFNYFYSLGLNISYAF